MSKILTQAQANAKKKEIAELGLKAARDEFNRANPPGEVWVGSAEGLQYAQGEFAALCEALPPLDTGRTVVDTRVHCYRFSATLPRPDRHGHTKSTGIVRTTGPKTDAEVIGTAVLTSNGVLLAATFTQVSLVEVLPAA